MVHPPARKTLANPRTVDPDHEQRVRECAYHLWEAEGKPHGRDVEFWERARTLVGAEESAVPEAPPAAETKPKAPRKQAAKAADIQAGMAEAPGASENPGEVKPGVAPKRKSPAKPKKPA
ncbi:MAG: DUF2934 domain-containing protein [Rhodopila sp.]